MAGRRAATRSTGTGLELLPLLDLLFATIGILIVVMLVQRIASVEVGRSYATDAVLACEGRAEATLYAAPDAAGQRVKLNIDALTSALAGIARKAQVNVLVGIAAACASDYDLFDRVARRLAQERNQLFRFAFVPMEPPQETLDRILRAWRGEASDGR